MGPLVSVSWLQQHSADPNLVILDASVSKIVGMTPVEYQHFCCIPNAIKCDLAGDFHLVSSKLTNTMPSPEQFAEQAKKLGLTSNSKIVIYDNQGIYSAPRAWWMFKVMGFEQVAVLNGGLPAWLQLQLPTHTHYQTPTELGDIEAHYQADLMYNKEQVQGVIDKDRYKIVDARSYSRFCGTDKEPRAGLRAGHIPGSVCLHFATLLQQGRYKDESQLQQLFEQAEITAKDKVIVSCGSGMTACIVLLAAVSIGLVDLALYDGSWSEWGADPNLPVATQ